MVANFSARLEPSDGPELTRTWFPTWTELPVESVANPPVVENLSADVVPLAEAQSLRNQTLQLPVAEPAHQVVSICQDNTGESLLDSMHTVAPEVITVGVIDFHLAVGSPFRVSFPNQLKHFLLIFPLLCTLCRCRCSQM